MPKSRPQVSVLETRSSQNRSLVRSSNLTARTGGPQAQRGDGTCLGGQTWQRAWSSGQRAAAESQTWSSTHRPESMPWNVTLSPQPTGLHPPTLLGYSPQTSREVTGDGLPDSFQSQVAGYGKKCPKYSNAFLFVFWPYLKACRILPRLAQGTPSSSFLDKEE